MVLDYLSFQSVSTLFIIFAIYRYTIDINVKNVAYEIVKYKGIIV